MVLFFHCFRLFIFVIAKIHILVTFYFIGSGIFSFFIFYILVFSGSHYFSLLDVFLLLFCISCLSRCFIKQEKVEGEAGYSWKEGRGRGMGMGRG